MSEELHRIGVELAALDQAITFIQKAERSGKKKMVSIDEAADLITAAQGIKSREALRPKGWNKIKTSAEKGEIELWGRCIKNSKICVISPPIIVSTTIEAINQIQNVALGLAGRSELFTGQVGVLYSELFLTAPDLKLLIQQELNKTLKLVADHGLSAKVPLIHLNDKDMARLQLAHLEAQRLLSLGKKKEASNASAISKSIKKDCPEVDEKTLRNLLSRNRVYWDPNL